MTKSVQAVLWSLVFVLLLPASASAGVIRDDKADTDWEIILAPYLWAQSLDGESNGIPLEASFGDILDNLNMALALHTEFHRGKWAFVIDPSYVSLEAEPEGLPVQPQIDIDIWLVEAWGSYKVTGNWELLAGARYNNQKLKVSGLGGIPTPPAPEGGFPDPVNVKDSWTDLFAGVRATYPLGAKWILTARGDIAFAGDSDSGYNLQVLFNRRIRKTMAVNIGYRYYKNDYDNTPTYTWDMKQQGPVVGYTWAF